MFQIIQLEENNHHFLLFPLYFHPFQRQILSVYSQILIIVCEWPQFVQVLVGYFHVFIVATGCPSERHPPKRQLVVTGDSARIQDETTENSNWFFNVLGV